MLVAKTYSYFMSLLATLKIIPPTTHIPLGIVHSENIVHFTIFSYLIPNVNNSDNQY